MQKASSLWLNGVLVQQYFIKIALSFSPPKIFSIGINIVIGYFRIKILVLFCALFLG